MTDRTTTDDPPIDVPAPGELRSVDVFVAGAGGGNPVPLVADAQPLTTEQMQAVARRTGHESAFLLPATRADADWRLRFFVPQHEMEMCGHATVGALWALRQWGRWTGERARVETLSGLVDARWDAGTARVWISQPRARVEALASPVIARLVDVLGLAGAGAGAVQAVNATTSRPKTLVRLADVATLHALRPDYAAIEALCDAIGSTGLYPFAIDLCATAQAPILSARQFPKASGYPEDAATGIAAAALWGHLADSGEIATGSADSPVICLVRQGEAMGRPSAIALQARFDEAGRVTGCWLSGEVQWS